MRTVRTAPLVVLVALGIGCSAWLVWRLAREDEPPAMADEGFDLRAAEAKGRAPPPAVAPRRASDDESLPGLLARWARTPQELARWRAALEEGGAGLGPFERRLWIGDLFEYLWRDLEAGRLPPDRASGVLVELFRAGALRIEGMRWIAVAARSSGHVDESHLRTALQGLTRPSRARRSFVLHGRESDALSTGRDTRLRVWTPRGQSVAPERVEQTLSLLRRLDTVAGVEAPPRVDLLATADCGDDVFPALAGLPFPFIGVYLPADHLAIVGTQHPPEAFRRLVQHEVIHAWQFAARPDWRATFAIEGLATYGSHLAPSDTGLQVPAARLRDDFAWLLDTISQLRRLGRTLEPMHMRALVRARPREFYSLGWFAYAVAEACFAYLDADALEEALRRGGEEALLARCESIGWVALLGWMEERAAGGNASGAWFVTESPPSGEEGSSDQTPDPVLLADLGLRVPPELRDRVARLLQGRRLGTRSGREASSAGPREDPVERAQGPEYLGLKNCKKCHFKHFRSWKRLPHARAYAILAPGEAVEAKRRAGLDSERDFRSGLECLPCHTTGYGTPSGYPVPRAGGQLTEELRRRASEHAGVACEACHGPGSEYAPYKKDHEDYLRAEIAARGAHVPLRAQHCTGCHKPGCPTMPRDYAFDFETARRSDRLHVHVPLRHSHQAGGR